MQEGHIIYQGPAKESPSYFSSIGYVIPVFSNPADYFMKKFYVPHKRTAIIEKRISILHSEYESRLLPKIND